LPLPSSRACAAACPSALERARIEAAGAHPLEQALPLLGWHALQAFGQQGAAAFRTSSRFFALRDPL
jgi:hypothetical protein